MEHRRLLKSGLFGGLLAGLILGAVTEAGAQTWNQLAPTGQAPTTVSGMNAVYNGTANSMIVFGGESAPRSNITSILSRANGLSGTPAWTVLSPQGGLPPGRALHSVVYDAADDTLIIFGGFSGTDGDQPILNDVWVLSNASGSSGTPAWTELSPTGGPPAPRAAATAVYDPTSNEMIVFGGCTGNNSSICQTSLNDTWVLLNANGLAGVPQWVQLQPTGAVPAPRNSQTAVYDPASNRMIVYGGVTGGGAGTIWGDVWALTDANGVGGTPQWVQLSPISSPPPRFNHTATYDPTTNSMTIFSGALNNQHVEGNDVWVLTSANGLGGTPAWSQLSPTGGPPLARENASAIYDPASKRMTIFSGYTNCSSACTVLSDVWVLTNANGVTGAGVTISPTSQSFTAAGGTGSIVVSAPTGYTWDATSSVDWIIVPDAAIIAPREGPGSGFVTYLVLSNPGITTRTGTITIAGLTFTVNQNGSGTCSYTVNPGSKVFPLSGGTVSVVVTANAGCAWTAVSNAAWAKVESGAAGSGHGTVVIGAGPNTNGPLSGTVTIAGHLFAVSQSGLACGATEVTDKVNVSQSAITDGIGLFGGGYFTRSVVVTNTTNQSIPGPVYAVFVGMPYSCTIDGVNGFCGLNNYQGVTTCYSATGSEYMLLTSGPLAPRQQVTIGPDFFPGFPYGSFPAAYTIKVLSGAPSH